MPNISVRLPPEIERSLEEEARLAKRNRSDVVREAVGEYLTRKQKERIIEEMRQAARALYSNPDALRQDNEIAEEGLEDWLQSIEREERAAGIDPDEKWWDRCAGARSGSQASSPGAGWKWERPAPASFFRPTG